MESSVAADVNVNHIRDLKEQFGVMEEQLRKAKAHADTLSVTQIIHYSKTFDLNTF
jgi:hypothetical protein